VPTLVLPNVPTNTDARGRRFRDVAIGVALVIIALGAPHLVRDGIERYAPGSQELAVAYRAYQGAWTLNDNPVARVLLPVARVSRVWREPGHCALNEPRPRGEAADFRAEVRFYSLFGVPGPVVHVRCGGWAYVW
jgi:hypothetical protein